MSQAARMSHPTILAGLTPREAIADAIHRAVIGLDEYDRKLFDSAIVHSKDTVVVLGELVTYTGYDSIIEHMFNRLGALDTHHNVSNIRIEIHEGGKTAYMSCYAIGQHYPPGKGLEPGAPYCLGGGMYYLDLVLDEGDGLWKIVKWVAKQRWMQGDISVIMG